MSFSPSQLNTIEVIERVTSVFSLVGTSIVITSFLASSAFRRPINRLIFYAVWGNTLNTVATLTGLAGIRAGQRSALCQFQAFLCQWLFAADVLWNLAMAINVYLTVFRKYTADDLRALEWRYLIMCYVLPFILAFVLIFVETDSRGRVYGAASLYCWISVEWGFGRVVFLYVPAWTCSLCAFAIYIWSGRAIFAKRQQLRAFSAEPTSFTSTITHTFSHHDPAALDANKAAWAYCRSALLFFLSLLISWVPPSINRLYTLVHDDQESYGLTVSAAVVLPLMGFWNSVIYLIVSHDIIRELFIRHFRRPSSRIGPNAGNGLGTGMTLTFMDPGKGSNPGHGRNKESRSDSTKRLAEEAAQIGRVV